MINYSGNARIPENTIPQLEDLEREAKNICINNSNNTKETTESYRTDLNRE